MGKRMKEKIRQVGDLRVFRNAMDSAMVIFETSRSFPVDERYSLTDQIRRSSRSVCANLAEAWRKRFYKAHFLSKLSDCAAEAEETRVWLQFALKCNYISKETFEKSDSSYDSIIGQLVIMMSRPTDWTMR